MSKRGSYHKYLRCEDERSEAKIPKQTKWNRKRKVSIIPKRNIIVEKRKRERE